MKRSRLLRVIGEQSDHAVALELAPVRRGKTGRLELRSPRRPRYSPEVTRDSEIDVEPLPYEAADGPACSIDDHRRYIQLRAARALAGTFEALPGVPATRAQCPPSRHETGCPFVRCKAHLALVTEDSRPGRPGLAKAPRDPHGHTVSHRGHLGADRGGTTLAPLWLRPGVGPGSMCAWDAIDQRGAMQTEQIGELLEKHRTLIGRALHLAIRKIAAAGLTADDLIRLIAPERRVDEGQSLARSRGHAGPVRRAGT